MAFVATDDVTTAAQVAAMANGARRMVRRHGGLCAMGADPACRVGGIGGRSTRTAVGAAEQGRRRNHTEKNKKHAHDWPSHGYLP